MVVAALVISSVSLVTSVSVLVLVKRGTPPAPIKAKPTAPADPGQVPPPTN